MTPEHGLNCLLGDHDLNWIINGYWTNKIDKFISIFISPCLFSKVVWLGWIKHVTPAFQKQFHMQIKVTCWTKFTSNQSGKSIAHKFSINVACVNSTCSISLMSIRSQGYVLESNKFHGFVILCWGWTLTFCSNMFCSYSLGAWRLSGGHI